MDGWGGVQVEMSPQQFPCCSHLQLKLVWLACMCMCKCGHAHVDVWVVWGVKSLQIQ